MSSHFDVIILGQGLAGTALGWSLRWKGYRVLVVDRESPVTPSKIAAGLMTPVTGQKLITTWRHSELWPVALAFYNRVQEETATEFFRRTAMVRLFATYAEAALFDRRQSTGEFDGLVNRSAPAVNKDWFAVERSGFEMSDGGQLNVPAYLSLSRRHFARDGGYTACDLSPEEDIVLGDNRVDVPKLSVTSKRLVFCQGFESIPNPWFREVQFKPAKGEILTLRIPGLSEPRVIHHRIWLAPLGDGLFKAGATYDWKNLDAVPTDSGRDEIVSCLREFLRLPFEIVAHEAAVRPIHRNQYPILGFHPSFPQLGFFNGLGSKGSLHAPFFARQLANAMVDGGSIDPEVELNRKTRWSQTAIQNRGNPTFHVKRGTPPLTQQAQDAVRRVVFPGDIVIDGTTGNGFDTEFLANLVGPAGTVFAFDIQQSALENTARRLAKAELQNVILFLQDHARLMESIPAHHRKKIAVIMFNLGYLPRGDKQLTTTAESTRQAIRQAAELLKPRGIMTILAYTGHDGGAAEAQAVAGVLEDLPKSDFEFETIESTPGRTSGPRMFLVRRLTTAEE